MKKIYMIMAAIALLSLSLNAQTKKAYRPSTTTQLSAPAKGPSRASSQPVTPPYTNDFSTATLFNWWEVINANNDTKTWTRNNSGYAQYSYHSTNYADDWLVTAPLTLEEGKAYTFSIETWCNSANYPEGIEVLLSDGHTATALENGVVLIQPTQVTATSTSHATLTKSFGVEQSGNYYIGIHAISDPDMYNLFVDNFSITVLDNPPHDLSVELAAPTSVYAGETATVTARVFNSQILPEKNYTVNITANGNVIHSETVTNALAAGDYATFTAQYATTQAQGGQTVNFGVQLVFSDDDATNNTATAQTAINILPPPENVAVEDGTAVVTWDAPSITASAITESFENFGVFPAFQTGGITTSVHSGAYGEWALYEPTGGYNYSLSGTSWPNANGPASFYPIAPNLAVPAWTSGAARTGAQYMLSTVPTSGSATDHWLISPELSGEAQTITFWVREITTQYGNETFEVLTSSTDNTYSSFSIVGSTRECSSTDWTQVTVTLPAGSKYFAIRHTSEDIFGLMIDDITYTPAPLNVLSYNIYLDGVLVDNVSSSTFSYDFGNVSGEHTCAVSAVYSYGESEAVPVTFSTTPKTATPTLSMVNNGDGTYTITATATSPDTDAQVTLNVTGQQPVTGTGSASITITQTDADQPVTATATAQATDKLVSNEASENFIVPALPITPTPAITYVVNGDNVVITATGQGEVTLNVTGQDPVTGNGTVSITLPRTDENYTVTATATAQAAYHQESAQASEEITVPFLQTAAPVITYTVDGDNVIITATGDGTVTLTVGGQTVSGEGSASITIPSGVVATTVTATATAQESGKAVSETTTLPVNIPAGEGWTEMTGTYNNPNDLLSFTVRVGTDTVPIMMLDQFLASTLYNAHPDGYNYVMKETIDGVDMSSNTVTVPVYKTSSTMQGFYTEQQVLSDTKMQLTPFVLNSEMDYDVHPDRNVLYYSLYRSGLDSIYPVIDVKHRVSQLQKFDELVGEAPNQTVQYFMFETHSKDVTPKYDHVGSETVERLDTNYVIADPGEQLAYVPVIWTFGLYTARGDGLNNSYGSDIKHEHMGDVNIVSIGGSKSGGNNAENTGNGWEGLFKVGDVPYCIYTPIITVEGITPETFRQNDGDLSEYEPYMFRVWCLYDGARDFGQNAQGILVDGGELEAPFLLGEVRIDDPTVNRVTIGSDWQVGQGRLPWAFAVPTATQSSDVQFAVRFYYKKKVTNPQTPSTLRANRDGEEGGTDEEYYIVEDRGDGSSIQTAIDEFYAGKTVTGVTYVNAQGMKSEKPFDGMNIVITRYSDGTMSTSKVMR